MIRYILPHDTTMLYQRQQRGLQRFTDSIVEPHRNAITVGLTIAAMPVVTCYDIPVSGYQG
jgi:hypothetical protein